MRLSLTVVDGRNGRAVDSLVDFDTEEPLAELVQPLAGLFGEQVHSSFARRIPMWVDGRAVHGDEAAGAAGVRSGCVVSLFEPFDGLTREMPGGVVELRVVAGPGAGRIHRLPLGETEVGCGASGWSLPDLRMPSNALTVRVGADGDVVVVPAPGLSATLEQEPLEHEVVWPVDAYLFVGDTILARADVELPTAEVRVDEAEALVDFNRPPRLLPPERERRFSLPDKPTDVRRRPFPWVMVFAPMFIAVPMGLIFGPRFLLFALFSPVMAIANFVSDRRTSRKDGVQSQKEYDAELVSVNERIERALLAERAANRISSPDPATLLLHAIGPGGRLWERRVDDPDYLRVRVGLAELPTGITVEERRSKTEEEPPPRMLAGVPSWLDLSQLGVVGVAGEEETSAPLARWLVAQLALLHSPRDLRVTVLSDAEGEVRWNWVRWLPHARADADHVTIGTQQDSVGRRLAELNALVAARTEQSRDRGRHVPDILVVLDGARRLRALPAVVELLRQGPRVGVMVLCLDDEPRQLPEECRAIVVCEAGRVQIQETAADDTTGVTPDLVELPWCETVARAISSLRDTTPQEESTGIPSSARLLDLIDMDPPTPDAVAALWSRGRRTDVVVGAGYDGPFRLDLRKDGPHALIAGTTGSGKSELLQTMVASLALANRPDEMTFVLVDYKGGSAFKDCARLPHTVGMVTDLDTHLVGRALVSLGAELRRREHLLAVPGAKDLEDYWALQRNQPELPAIPRLALVIDEFASLAAELPDFVQGLVSIAQRGRSLGIHLVLATQRPSGVVSADIRANTNLRISLRVTDENDSRDVLDAPDAARILKSQPGRAYVRTGASTLMPFQSGRVGGRSPGAGPNDRVGPAALAWPIPWDKVGVPAPVRPKDETEQTDESDTDLAAVVDAIEKANTSLSVPPQHRPWLDALPEIVLRRDLPTVPATASASEPAPVPWALEDLPELQEQRSRTFQLGRSGHLYVIGGPRSGRSTTLRTLAAAIADDVPACDVHIYGLDCGNGALLGLGQLPHTGAIATRTQVERADRLLARLVNLVEERQHQLGAGGFADLAELRESLPADQRPPYVVFLLDRWDGFTFSLGEVDGGRMTEQVMRLLRDGTSVGLHVAISGDRSLVTGRMSTLVENRIVLRLADRGDYSVVGVPTREVPERLPDGRALTPDPVVELQIAVLVEDLSGGAQNVAVREIARRRADRDDETPSGQRPFRLESLPNQLPFDDPMRREVVVAMSAPGQRWTPMGAGGDDLRVLGLDLSGTPVSLVAGPPKSGRTNALRFVVAAAAEAGLPVLGLCPVANDLWRDLESRGAGLLTDDLPPEDLVARLRDLPAGALVVIDDAELLKEGPLASALLALVQQARGKAWRVMVAGATAEIGSGYGGWIYELRKARQGLLLSPQSMSDGDIYSLRLLRSTLVPRVHPGRGLLIDAGGGQELVQVPLV